MTIELHEPETEALIQQRMASGAFHNVEEVILHALKSTPAPTSTSSDHRTGAEIIAAMQRMPYPDLDIEPFRPAMSVRESEF